MIKNVNINHSKSQFFIDIERLERKAHRRRKVFRTKVGIIAGLMIMAGSTSAAIGSMKKESPVVYHKEAIKVSKDDLNELNLVLINESADGDVFSCLTEELDNEQISYKVVDGMRSLTPMDKGGTLVSFVGYAGKRPKLIAEYEERGNNSDPLVMGLNAGLLNYSLADRDEGIQCGVKVINENGNTVLGPTKLEREVCSSCSSYATMALPNNYMPTLGKAFIEGLARYKYYIDRHKTTNLITRVKATDDLEEVARRNGLNVERIIKYNPSLEPDHIKQDQTLYVAEINEVLTRYQDVELISEDSSKHM